MSPEFASRWRTRLAPLLPMRVRDVLRFILNPERYAYFGAAFSYRKDGLATIHRADFSRDPAFQAAYGAARKAGAFAGSWGQADPEWRMYVACWAGRHAAGLRGDFVECGVYRGGLSRTVMDYIGLSKMSGRTYWLLDTFEGIPPSLLDDTVVHRHLYPDTWAEASAVFGGRPGVRLVRGAIPGTLAQVTADEICFVSIDMNVTEPEIAAAEYFWPRMVPGGVIVLDDYGWHGHEAQKAALDEFAARQQRTILALPTGQGLLFK